MAENTTKQLTRWRKDEPLTAQRLNEMVDSLNFLLKSVGFLLNRTALANYVPSDASSFNYPGVLERVMVDSSASTPSIKGGILVLPASTGAGLSGVRYDYTALTPTVKDGELVLNLATYEASSGSAFPGAVTGLQLYDPADASSPAAPGIASGVIQLPAALTSIENVSGSITPQPAPGADGWEQTLLILGTYQNGSLQFSRWDRQLMRLHGSTLQVVQQESYDGSTWSDSSA